MDISGIALQLHNAAGAVMEVQITKKLVSTEPFDELSIIDMLQSSFKVLFNQKP